MRAVSANLFALLFLCTCASVFYVWDTLENRLERHKRGFHLGSLRPGPPADLSTKTFRTLLAVPAAHRLHPGGGNSVGLEVHNLTNVRDQTDRYRMNVDNTGSTRGEDPVGSPVEEGIFWNKRLDDNLHVGFTEEHARAWRERARGHRVVKLEPGCGRISNQLATFSDGTRACVRYGINADQVLGETLTYYLASLLGITNVPPLVLAQLNADGDQWSSVRRRIGALQWGERAVVSLTEWVSNLTGVVTPAPLRQQQQSSGGQSSGGLVPQLVPQGVEPSAAGGLGGLHPLRDELRNKTAAELAELVQWSDLIVLDYLTANFDRLVSNLFSLQWDPRVMERDTNNLLRTPRGDLVFIDNEAGLVHGYRVLNMWEKYHSAVLGSVCVFRRRTAQRVAELHRRRDARTRLLDRYRDNEPLSSLLGFLSDEHAGVLQDRIDRLYKHILHCKGRFSQL